MYPEGAEGGDDTGAPSGGGGAFSGRVAYHMEGLVPVVLIIVIGALLANYYGVVDLPFLPTREQPASVLYIGTPSRYTGEVLAEAKKVVHPITYRSGDSISRNAKQQLPQFDMVILDQSVQSDKSISHELGDALEEWVKSGGKLLVVKDSATRLKEDFAVIGWEGTLNGIVPASCEPVGISQQPSCTVKRVVAGKIYPNKIDHEITRGVQYGYPSDPGALWRGEILDITFVGNEIAYIEVDDGRTKKQYTAISEKPLFPPIGKVVYFNYDPGTTPEIFLNTLKYMTNR